MVHGSFLSPMLQYLHQSIYVYIWLEFGKKSLVYVWPQEAKLREKSKKDSIQYFRLQNSQKLANT